MRRLALLPFVASFVVASFPLAAKDMSLVYANRAFLPLSFEHPADWEVEPSAGTTERYSQVQLYAAKQPGDLMRTYMVIRAIPPKAKGGRYDDREQMISSFKSTLLRSMTIEGEQSEVVAGVAARVLEIGGTLNLPWESVSPTPVPVAGQRVFFERDGWLYQASWLTTPDHADAVRAIFTRLLSTLAPIPE